MTSNPSDSDLATAIAEQIGRAARAVEERTGTAVAETTQAFTLGVLFPRMHDLLEFAHADGADVYEAAIALFEIGLHERNRGAISNLVARGSAASLGIPDLAAAFARWPPPFGTIGV